MTLHGGQIRGARRRLQWSRLKLALQAGVGIRRTNLVVAGPRMVSPANIDKVRSALEASGIAFDNEGHGSRLVKAEP